MALVCRLLFPASAVACLLGACSGKTIERPGDTTEKGGTGVATTQGGSDVTTTQGGSGVTTTQGGSGGVKAQGGAGGAKSSGGAAAGGSGGGAVSGGLVAPGGVCTKTLECAGSGFICKAELKVCTCPADKPDACGKGAGAVCTLNAADPDNCGACGTKCDAGATCVASQCGPKPTTLTTATGCGGGVRLAIHGSSLYWTEMKTGKVRTMPVGGGAITDVATGQLSPTQITVDDQGVYWANQGDASAASSKVLMKPLPLEPGEPTVVKAALGQDKLPAIALHLGKVYYALHTEVHQLTLNQAGDTIIADIVVGVAVNYEDPQNPIVSGEPKGLAVNDTRVVWDTPDDRSAVESHTLTEVTDVNDSTGYAKLGKSIGALLRSGDVGIDAQYGYWANGERFERNILTDQNGQSQIVTIAPDSILITAFVLNATNVYASTEDGGIFTHSLLPPADPNDESTDVPPVRVARDQTNVTSMVLDATRLYWVTSDCVIRSAGL